MGTIVPTRVRAASFVIAALAIFIFASLNRVAAQDSATPQAAQSASKVKTVGTIKLISGTTVTLTTDSGSEVTVSLQPSTRLLRMAPGQPDLKQATSIQAQDLQVGDRLLAGGTSSDGGKSVTATTVVVMTKADVAAKQERDREDWQKRGVGGVVKTVDTGTKTVTISTGAVGSNPLAVHISKETIIRRYALDSVKFDDAKPGTFDQIKAGDQLRARGTKNADSTELVAEEIVSGTFRNVAGLVVSTDPGAGTVTLTDLVSKRPVTLKITSDSQLHKLPAMMAQRIAARLKGGPAHWRGGRRNTRCSSFVRACRRDARRRWRWLSARWSARLSADVESHAGGDAC